MTDLVAVMRQAFAAYERDELDETERLCGVALAADSGCFDAHHLLGVLYTRREQPDKALASYERALAIRPDHPQLLSNRAVVLDDWRRFEEALVCLDKAVALQPDHAAALSNRGNTLSALRRFDEALENYDKALALIPNFADCRFNRAMLLLMRGRQAEGWREYEWRRALKSWTARAFTAPEWRGEEMSGRTLLLYAEQGLGDTMQFARFGPLLAARGVNVVLWVQPSLRRLLHSLEGVAAVVDGSEALPQFDRHLPLLSVPFALGLGDGETPAAIPYLAAEPERVAHWAARLPSTGGLRVGIAWQGDPKRKIDRGRSPPLAAYAPLAGIPGVRLFSLQKNDGLEQLAKMPAGMRVETLGEDFDAGPDGFLDTAAVMMHLDLVITSDSAVAHLAGALGRPVWIVLKDVPDWRWLLDREDSPWYPTARLFRQTRRDDWSEVFARLAARLATAAREGLPAPNTVAPARRPQQPKRRDAAGLMKSALAAYERGEIGESERLCRAAIAADPRCRDAHNLLGVALSQSGRHADALASYEKALALRPDDADALSNRGNALHQLRRYDEALASFDRALELRPGFAEALSNRGSTLHELLRYAEALASYDRALALRPDYPHALSNRGLVLADLRRYDEALASYDRALAVAPDYAECRFNRALLLLALGRFAEGWREYDARFAAGHVVLPRLQQPRWNGEPLAGRTLLLIAEQGYGDTLQFCRYASLLAAQGRVVLLAPRPLARLLAGLAGVAQIVSDGDALPPFDLYCPLLSLPAILGTTLGTIPADVPYLKADPAQIAFWWQRLDRLPGLRVGLVWAGNPRLDQPGAHAIDARRSIALAEFGRLAAAEGVSFVSLQKGPPAAQASATPPGLQLHDWTGELSDFADTAALVTALDLVITVDTAVAHLAGALGKPVWVLSRYDGCWRWLLGRDDSPWYPSLRLFHQQAPGDWSGALEQVMHRLAALAREEIVRPPPPALAGDAARAAAAVAMQAALAAYQRGASGEALAEYDRATALCPDDPQAWSNRGVLLHTLGRHPEALASLDRALALLPDFPQALSNHGSTLHELGRYAEALASHDRALALAPEFAQAWSNRGNTLYELERYEEAVASCERALALLPAFPQALSNRGIALRELGRGAEALASFDQALALQPDFVDCRFKRALVLLQLGRFAEGWRDYEARRHLPSWGKRALAGPEWQGDDLGGRTLLLYAEQGLGDTIQFARFASRLAAGGANIVLQVQPQLCRLLAGLGGVTVMGLGDDPGAIDCHLPLMSVPGVLGLDESGFAAPGPYLAAEPARVQHWASRLPAGGLRIGIAWQGKPGRLVDRGRSPSLAAFAPLAAIPGIRLISLQKNAGTEQLAGLSPGVPVETLGDEFDAGPDAFLDAAAVITQLDLVITCDSAIAHLAGALGRPVWIVLQHVPDWRWQLGREDSAWYQTARLFRQPHRGNWDEVFRQVAAELSAWMAPAGSSSANVPLATAIESPSTPLGQYAVPQQKAPASKSPRARTLVFCTAFAADPGVWETRYQRWLEGIRGGGLQFDQVLIVDDGSPNLPEWPDVQVMTEAMPLAPTKPTVLFHFRNHLGRHSVFDFPGWYRSFTFAATFARQNGFNRIIHIESDAYLISRRIVEYVNGLDDGWTAFWCRRWNFPEIAIQVIAGASTQSFIEIAKLPYSAFGGEPPEKMLPFTNVERSFEGDRYGEYADRVPRFADYTAQTPADASPEYYWWLTNDAPALTDTERREEEYLFAYLDGIHLATNGGDIEQTLATFRRAAEIAPHRAEPLHAAATVCFAAGRYEEGYQIAKRGIDLPLPGSGLGIEPGIYEHGLLEAISLNAYRAGRHEEAISAGERLLCQPNLPDEVRRQVSTTVELAREGLNDPLRNAPSGPWRFPPAASAMTARTSQNGEDSSRLTAHALNGHGLDEKMLKAMPDARRVLEIGCGTGRLGAAFKQRSPEALWFAVDSDAQAVAEAARRLDMVFHRDLDRQGLGDVGFGFDCVVLSDSMQYLVNAGPLLAELEAVVDPAATLLLRVPNIGHITLFERLLLGDLTHEIGNSSNGTAARMASPASMLKLLLDAGWLPDVVDRHLAAHPSSEFMERLLTAASAVGIPEPICRTNLLTTEMIVRARKWPARPAVPTIGAPVTAAASVSVVVPVNNEVQLALNVMPSPGLLELGVEIIACREQPSAAAALRSGIEQARNEWVIFCHQDVYFPRGTGLVLSKILREVPPEQRSRTLIGFVGIARAPNGGDFCAGLVLDRLNTLDWPEAPLATSIDELAVVVSRDTEFDFDESLGWHLWATDLCLQALRRGFPPARIVRVPLFHNSLNYSNPDSFQDSAKILARKYPEVPRIVTLCGLVKDGSPAPSVRAV